jgi:cell wall-associated NlpC family hydrolase
MKKLSIIAMLSIFIATGMPVANAQHKTIHHHKKVTHSRKRHASKGVSKAMVTPIPIKQLEDYADYPAEVKKLIANAEKLSEMNLTYKFGSADPRQRGMDCSGTINYLLNESNLEDVPRDAESLYYWVKEEGNLHRVSGRDLDAYEFSKLKPGDLLFWSGTYATTREISHVMMYLGRNKDGQPLMFGSSNGRTYQGKKMWGVSVFDFRLPNGRGKQKFVGYGCIPGINCA